MDCCGHAHCHGHALTRRQWIWSTVLSSVGTMLAGGVGPRGSTAAAQTAETASAALDLLRKSISVDVHTHGAATRAVLVAGASLVPNANEAPMFRDTVFYELRTCET